MIAGFEKQYPQVKEDLVNVSYPTYFDQLRSAALACKGLPAIAVFAIAQKALAKGFGGVIDK